MALNTNKREGDKLHAEEWNELVQEVQGKQPRLNIVDALDSTSSVDVLSAKQGKVLDEKITSANTAISSISDKVDKLPTGIYYGQHDSEEDLEDIQVTTKGYAYIASTDPAVYYIYLYDNGTWTNSGNKFVTTNLETDLSTKSETKAPTTKIVAEGIESVNLLEAKTPTTELTKAQKYQASANINNRTADVVVATGEVKALGYKVLNPALSFAEQIIEANTIYEIRDGFNIQNLDVDTICVCNTKVTFPHAAGSGTTDVYVCENPITLNPNCSIVLDGFVLLTKSNNTYSVYQSIGMLSTPIVGNNSAFTYYVGIIGEAGSVNVKTYNQVIIPANCTLKFNGGFLKGGVIRCNNTVISGGKGIFNTDCYVCGTITTPSNASWFVEEGDTDMTKGIQKSVFCFYNTEINGSNYIDSSINISTIEVPERRTIKINGAIKSNANGFRIRSLCTISGGIWSSANEATCIKICGNDINKRGALRVNINDMSFLQPYKAIDCNADGDFYDAFHSYANITNVKIFNAKFGIIGNLSTSYINADLEQNSYRNLDIEGDLNIINIVGQAGGKATITGDTSGKENNFINLKGNYNSLNLTVFDIGGGGTKQGILADIDGYENNVIPHSQYVKSTYSANGTRFNKDGNVLIPLSCPNYTAKKVTIGDNPTETAVDLEGLLNGTHLISITNTSKLEVEFDNLAFFRGLYANFYITGDTKVTANIYVNDVLSSTQKASAITKYVKYYLTNVLGDISDKCKVKITLQSNDSSSTYLTSLNIFANYDSKGYREVKDTIPTSLAPYYTGEGVFIKIQTKNEGIGVMGYKSSDGNLYDAIGRVIDSEYSSVKEGGFTIFSKNLNTELPIAAVLLEENASPQMASVIFAVNIKGNASDQIYSFSTIDIFEAKLYGRSTASDKYLYGEIKSLYSERRITAKMYKYTSGSKFGALITLEVLDKALSTDTGAVNITINKLGQTSKNGNNVFFKRDNASFASLPKLALTVGYSTKYANVTSNGTGRCLTRGTSSERPKIPATSSFMYFDTTLGKPIFWDGTAWVDANGETVGLQVSDTSILIGAAQDSSKTINIYSASTITAVSQVIDETSVQYTTGNTANIVESTSYYAGSAINLNEGDIIRIDGTAVILNASKDAVVAFTSGNSYIASGTETIYLATTIADTTVVYVKGNWLEASVGTASGSTYPVTLKALSANSTAPRGAKVIITNTDGEVVIVNIIQSY